MVKGFERQDFSRYSADCKRANRHLWNAFKLAEKNGVAKEALATAFLNAATALMVESGGRQMAQSSLQVTYDRIEHGEFDARGLTH